MTKRIRFLYFILPMLLVACDQVAEKQSLTQAEINMLANNLVVRYEIINNLSDDECYPEYNDRLCFRAELSLTLNQSFKNRDWEIYFSEVRAIKKDSSDEFDIQHINGDLHRIKPTEYFNGFEANETKVIPFRGGAKHLAESDLMPNYYLVAEGYEPVIIKGTQAVTDPETGLEQYPHIVEFTDLKRHFMRSPVDNTQWATAEYIFNKNQDVINDPSAVQGVIIPTPKKVVLDKQNSQLDLTVGVNFRLKNVRLTDIEAAVSRLKSLGVSESEKGINVNIAIFNVKDKPMGSYVLDIKKDLIDIVAYDAAGASYALYSLASLIKLEHSQVPIIRVIDEPRYQFRGMLLDVARNFHDKDFVLNLLDQMAAYKLNKLHLHLTDDEGWRLEIKTLPELTGIASKRCHDLTETKCLLPQLGSGPDGDSIVNGYFSVANYQEILQAASARHIQVIPSFDMPGHSRAAIKAMEARYKRLMSEGKQAEAEKYLLNDLNDKTIYASVQNYSDNTINVCMESSYAFVNTVIDEIQKIHKEVDHPLTRYHIGADETAGAWIESPACNEFLKANPYGITDAKQLGGYYIERVATILDSKGIEPAAWSDGISHTKVENMPQLVQANAWGGIAQRDIALTNELANRGWEIVLSTPEVLYFDFPQAADPKERGYYWASRQTTGRKVFNFMPDNLPVHAEFWLDVGGQSIEINDTIIKDIKGNIVSEPLKKGVHFIGMQGQLWSETIRTDEQAQYMIFPRLLALAERAWHKAEWEVPYNYSGAIYNDTSRTFTKKMRQQHNREWNRFANVLGHRELNKLDLAGITYRIPTVGAKVIDEKLYANIIYPGLTIEYRIDGGDWLQYTDIVSVGSGKIEVRARSANGQRKGRVLKVH